LNFYLAFWISNFEIADFAFSDQNQNSRSELHKCLIFTFLYRSQPELCKKLTTIFMELQTFKSAFMQIEFRLFSN